jgi:7-cyano-7-deazaguanine synthase
LTDERAIEMQANGLPNTFVPGRNLLFLTFAATLAYRRGASVLVGGMCETDFSGYPDCRDNTLKALQVALSLGLDAALVKLIVEDTHTCYLGERGELHDWGHGCGHCPACALRAKGFAAYRSGQGGRDAVPQQQAGA